jgi:hypothetical protein
MADSLGDVGGSEGRSHLSDTSKGRGEESCKVLSSLPFIVSFKTKE